MQQEGPDAAAGLDLDTEPYVDPDAEDADRHAEDADPRERQSRY